jgi:hypothetical protein
MGEDQACPGSEGAMGRAIKVSEEVVARAARMYRLNKDAARALDISGSTFTDYCEKFGIETPAAPAPAAAGPRIALGLRRRIHVRLKGYDEA